MARATYRLSLVVLLVVAGQAFAGAPAATQPAIRVVETADAVHIETDAIHATINKIGYVTGIAAGSLVDKQSGARDLGYGLHVWDFLLAPGWRDDGYDRSVPLHGNLPKHYVEGPQICTQAKHLPVQVIRGEGFVACRLSYTFIEPGKGHKAGSTWEQTLLFQPGVRYVLTSERVTSANDVDDLFYRIDMPGHVKKETFDQLNQVYLSYAGRLLTHADFAQDFAPDARFLYQREGRSTPRRMIRAYQVRVGQKPGPWLAGMTLQPGAVAEAWCHMRGYICFIEELHRKHVTAGDTIGTAYIVGWFDDIDQMNSVYDRYRGTRAITVEQGGFRLER